MDYYDFENRLEHEGIVAMASAVLSHLATFGEEEVEKAWRKRYEPRIKDWLSKTPGVVDNLQPGQEGLVEQGQGVDRGGSQFGEKVGLDEAEEALDLAPPLRVVGGAQDTLDAQAGADGIELLGSVDLALVGVDG